MPPIMHFAPPPGVKSPRCRLPPATGTCCSSTGIPASTATASGRGFEAEFGLSSPNIKPCSTRPARHSAISSRSKALTRASRCRRLNVRMHRVGPAPYPARTTCVVDITPPSSRYEDADRDEGVEQLRGGDRCLPFTPIPTFGVAATRLWHEGLAFSSYRRAVQQTCIRRVESAGEGSCLYRRRRRDDRRQARPSSRTLRKKICLTIDSSA